MTIKVGIIGAGGNTTKFHIPVRFTTFISAHPITPLRAGSGSGADTLLSVR